MKKYPDRYIFPAIFSKDEEGMWDVRFPDLDNCFTSADTLEEAHRPGEIYAGGLSLFSGKRQGGYPCSQRYTAKTEP